MELEGTELQKGALLVGVAWFDQGVSGEEDNVAIHTVTLVVLIFL
jgi:hypothetical protein